MSNPEIISRGHEKFGICVPIGPNIIMATPISTLYNPKGIIDLTAKTWPVWFTARDEEINGLTINRVIGPNGYPSRVALNWSEERVRSVIYIERDGIMVPLDTKSSLGDFTHHKIGHRADMVYRPDPVLLEYYTVIRLSQEPVSSNWEMAKRYFNLKPRPLLLISGMDNRTSEDQEKTTSLLESIVYPKLPFGRILNK